uniref:Limonoid UDP-glucosyltransferase n=1 Tax=Cajanus cajan TaxID=3821 RepID=A0A151RY87_CAJCA|nr:Limonoid UDP-glucosyltransferase [Cajanus cajan]
MLRLGKCLAARGCYVTFSTTKGTQNLLDYTAHLDRIGKQFVSEMLKKHAEAKRPVSCIINNPFFSWVNDVAAEHGIPTALYWIHSAATFTACHRYFQKLSPFPTDSSPYTLVELPGGVVLKHSEIPDFLHPFSRTPFLKTLVRQQFENLSKTFCVLMDTFQELEQGYLDYLSQFHLVRPVGPLFKNPSSAALRNDDCMEWLNSKPRASVVYISLGTIVSLSVEQIGEFAHGLLNSRVSFLWVLSGSEREEALKANVMPDGFFERTSERGKVVQWSPQVEVLAHPSVACYLSHCGWNSTMEALASGVPMLTFSQISDQVTNAKFVVDVYGVGIRVRGDETEEKVISRDEIQRLLVEAMVGPKAEELKQNALKWKSAAEAAWAHGGSSHRNLDAFVEDLKKLSHVTKTPQ